tara:strand:+ start:178 stop:375 length:198 start_codon:yes stop_codon:yes gene_type:complete
VGKNKKNNTKDIKVRGGQIFLVKLLDDDKNKISQVGPFHDKEEAINTCHHFLKKGTCSWLVRYNG